MKTDFAIRYRSNQQGDAKRTKRVCLLLFCVYLALDDQLVLNMSYEPL